MDNRLFIWQKYKEYYHKGDQGEIIFHEDAPQEAIDSFEAYQEYMGKINNFGKREIKKKFFSFSSDTNMKVSKPKMQSNSKLKVYEEKDEDIKQLISSKVLKALPNYFADMTSLQNYVEQSIKMPFFVCKYEGNNVGFMALKQHNEDTIELYVLGVYSEYHRKGVGKAMLQEVLLYAKQCKVSYLSVKTLDSSSNDEHYLKTIAFYQAMGFKKVEILLNEWESQPCLLMIRKV